MRFKSENISFPIAQKSIKIKRYPYEKNSINLDKQVRYKGTRYSDALNFMNLVWNKFWCCIEKLKYNLPVNLTKRVLNSYLVPCVSYAK